MPNLAGEDGINLVPHKKRTCADCTDQEALGFIPMVALQLQSETRDAGGLPHVPGAVRMPLRPLMMDLIHHRVRPYKPKVVIPLEVRADPSGWADFSMNLK